MEANAMELDQDKSLREHLLYLLRGGGAHLDFESVIKDFPIESINREIAHLPYTAWQLLEHMRIAQSDILEFSRNASHVSPDWPTGYWPEREREADASDWSKSVEAFRKDLAAMESLVSDTSINLFAPLAHGQGQTILREALLVADHNAYHLGALVNIKRILMATGDDA
jgi:hypothetical protein